MNILAPEATTVNTLARVQAAYGYNLYVARQPITRCTNADQRGGWHNAQRGEQAAADAETDAYLSTGRRS